jgi:hypothetical protein
VKLRHHRADLNRSESRRSATSHRCTRQRLAEAWLMLSLTGPGHISDFLGGSNREFEKSKRGCPPRFCRCPCGVVLAASQRLAIRSPSNCTIYDNRRDKNASKIRELFQWLFAITGKRLVGGLGLGRPRRARRMRTGTFTVVLRLFRFASPVTPQLCAEQQRRAIGFTKPEERHQCHRRSRHHEECGRYFVAGAFHEPGCHQR